MKKLVAGIMVFLICALVAQYSQAYKRSEQRAVANQKVAEDGGDNKDVGAKGKSKKADIPVYSNDVAERPYVVIGKLSFEKGSNIGTCEAKLGRWSAKKYGADAILNYKLTQAHLCEGVAVRWAEEGEEGLTRISENTPVPIIEGKKVTFRW